MTKFIALCLALFCAFIHAQPIPADKLFSDRFFINPKLSHSGQYMGAYVIQPKGEKLFIVYDKESNQFQQVAVFQDKVKLDDYYWLNDETLLLTIVKKYESKNMVIKLNKDAQGVMNPTSHMLAFDGHLIDALPEYPNKILFDVYEYQCSGTVNLAT